MKYNPLGHSDLLVSEVSFGCMSLGEDQTQNDTMLQQAFNQGITLFDTADLYQQGQNEISVGKAFKGMRHQVIIATKVGNQWRADGSGWDWNPRMAYIIQAVEESLKRLQTGYIDLYQLHGGTLDDPIDEIIETFELLKLQGKIRHYGISSIRPNVIREYVNRSNITSVMMQYSLLDRRPEESCLDLLHQHQIGVLARGSLAKGLLVNKPAAAYGNYSPEEVAQAAKAIRLLANQMQTTTGVAIQFALRHPAVTSAVVGIRTLEQLAACIQASQDMVMPLTEEEIRSLAAALPIKFYEEHR
ncbi:MAG: aldo/keto reductase [Bacteroidota bacterium]